MSGACQTLCLITWIHESGRLGRVKYPKVTLTLYICDHPAQGSCHIPDTAQVFFSKYATVLLVRYREARYATISY